MPMSIFSADINGYVIFGDGHSTSKEIMMVQNALHCDVSPGRFLVLVPCILCSSAYWLESVVSSAKERRSASTAGMASRPAYSDTLRTLTVSGGFGTRDSGGDKWLSLVEHPVVQRGFPVHFAPSRGCPQSSYGSCSTRFPFTVRITYFRPSGYSAI